MFKPFVQYDKVPGIRFQHGLSSPVHIARSHAGDAQTRRRHHSAPRSYFRPRRASRTALPRAQDRSLHAAARGDSGNSTAISKHKLGIIWSLPPLHMTEKADRRILLRRTGGWTSSSWTSPCPARTASNSAARSARFRPLASRHRNIGHLGRRRIACMESQASTLLKKPFRTRLSRSLHPGADSGQKRARLKKATRTRRGRSIPNSSDCTAPTKEVPAPDRPG